MRTLLLLLLISSNALAINAEDVLIKRELLVEKARMAFCTEISIKKYAWSERKCLPVPRFPGPEKYEPFLADNKVLITKSGQSACVYAAPFNEIPINEFLICVDDMRELFSMAASGINRAEMMALIHAKNDD